MITSRSAPEYRLLKEEAPSARETGSDALIIPPGVSHVETPGQGGGQVSIEKGTSAAPAAVLEVVATGTRPTLLLEVPAGTRAHVNGSPAGRLEVLEVGDVIHLEPSVRMHVTLHQRDPVGPAGETLAGRKCLVCGTRILATQRVCVCGNCGTALHLEEGPPESEPLECARLVFRCPHCREALRFEGGYVYEPGA